MGGGWSPGRGPQEAQVPHPWSHTKRLLERKDSYRFSEGADGLGVLPRAAPPSDTGTRLASYSCRKHDKLPPTLLARMFENLEQLGAQTFTFWRCCLELL